MPGISEQLAQRGSNRGVTVYSPTRPVRRPGTTADAGTANRILNRPIEVNARVNETGARGPSIADLLTIKPQVDRQRQQAEDEAWKAGRWPGPLEIARRPVANVVSSPVFRAVMAPLNLLDYPRRAVASTLQELADAFNGGDASWSDWIDQVKDPSFGGGQMFGDHPNPLLQGAFGGSAAGVANLAGSDTWANRFTGFGFDMATDPLNYLAGSSALNGAGRAERLALVARLSQGGAEDLIPKVSKFGLAALTDAERTRVAGLTDKAGNLLGGELRQAGFRWVVPFSDVESPPFLGRVERGLAMGRARLRNTANTWMGRIFADIRSPMGMEEVYQKLVRGTGRYTYSEAAERLVAYNAAKQGIGETLGRGAAGLAHVLSAAKNPEQLRQWMRDAQLLGTGPVAEEFFHVMKQHLDDVGFNTSEWSDKYVHRVLADWAREFMATGDARAKSFAKFFGYNVDELAQDAPPLHHRVWFLPGTHEIHGQKIVITATDGIEEINRKIATAFPDLPGKFFEEDFSKIATSYTKSIAKSAGSIRARQRLMNSKANLLRAADDPDVHNIVTNVEATMDLNKEAKKKMEALMSVAAGSARTIKAQLRQERKGISGAVKDQIRASLIEITAMKKDRLNHINSLLDNLNTLGNAPQQLVDAFHAELARIDTHFDGIVDQLTQISKRAANDLKRWRDGGGVGPIPPLMGKVGELRQAAATAASERRLMEAMLDQALVHHQLADRFDHWVDDPLLLDRLATVFSGQPDAAARAPQGRRWVDGLGRERTGPVTHDVEATISNPSTITTLIHQDVSRVATITDLDQVMAGLPRDVVSRITHEAMAMNGAIHTAAVTAAQAERHLAVTQAQHGSRVAEAILEHARSSAAVTMAQDHVLSLEGRVAIGDANAQALDRLNAAQMVQRNTQRELDRANAPIVMALQHRDSMVNELENLQTKQISILEDGIAQAQVGLDPGVLNDTARVNAGAGGAASPEYPDLWESLTPATETAPREQPIAHPDPYEPSPVEAVSVEDQLRTLDQEASAKRQEAAFFRSEHHDVDQIAARDAVRQRDSAAEQVMVETGGRSKTFTADPGGPVRLKSGHPEASAVEARRDLLRTELENTSANLHSARQRLHNAHRDIIDNGPSAERRAELNAARSSLTDAEKSHARLLKQVHEIEQELVGFEANPALRQRWRKLMRQRYEYAVEEGRLSHNLDRAGPRGEMLREQAEAARAQATELRRSRLPGREGEPREFGRQTARGPAALSREEALRGHRLRQQRLNYIESMIARGAPPDRVAVLQRQANILRQAQTETLDAAAAETVNRIRDINARQLSTVKTMGLAEEPRQVIQHLATAYSVEDRALLTEAYRVLREPGGDPEGLVRVQRENLTRINARMAELSQIRGGGGVDVTQLQMLNEEMTALRRQHRELTDALVGTKVTGPTRREVAKQTVARIEAKAKAAARGVREGMSAEAVDLRTQLDRIFQIRGGVPPDVEAQLEGVNLNLYTPQEATTHAQAREVLRIHKEVDDRHTPLLLERGAVDQVTVDRTRARADKLKELLTSYGGKPSPYAGKRIRQESADLARDVDVMAAYALVIHAGIEPTPMVGAYVLRSRLLKEMAELNEQIDVRVASKGAKALKLEENVKQAIAGHQVQVAQAQFDIDLQTAQRGKAGFDERALNRAKSKKSYYNGLIKKLEAKGELSFQQVSELDDLVDQMAQVYKDLFEPLWRDDKLWKRARDGIAEGRSGYVDVAHRARMGVEYLRPEAETYTAAMERLQTAIQEAEASGSDVVRWLDATSQEFIDPLTGKAPTTQRVAEALGLTEVPGAPGIPRDVGDPALRRQRIISSEHPENVTPLARRARRRQQQELVNRRAPGAPPLLEIPEHRRGYLEVRTAGDIAAGRKKISIRQQVLHTEETEMGLEEAKKLLAQRADPSNINTPVRRLERQEAQLAVFDGSAQRRVDQLDTLIEDLQQPPNIATLIKDNSDIETKAARHNGGVLTEEQQTRFTDNLARIEQAKRLSSGQLSAEDVRAITDEREQLMINIDRIMKKEDLDELSYRDAIDALTAPDRFMRDVFAGRIELNAATRERLKEMVGPEMGELQIQMRNVLDQAESEGWSEDELRQVLGSLYGTRYVTDAEDVGPIEAVSGYELADPSVEGTASPVRGGGDATARARQTMLVDFIKSRESSKIANEREVRGMLELLGINLMPGERDQTKAFDQLRKLLSFQEGKEPDLTKIKQVITERMIELGYDPTRAGDAVVREMMARHARLQAWASSLGAVLPDEVSAITDPVAYFTQLENRLRTVAAGRDADDLVSRLIKFKDRPLPQNVQAIATAHMTELRQKLAAAEAVGDIEAVAELQQQIARAEAGVPPPVSVVPPPPDVTPEQWAQRHQGLETEASALAQSRQEITAQRDELAAELAKGGPQRPTNVSEEAIFWRARMNDMVEAQSDPEELLTVMQRANEAAGAAEKNPTGPLIANEDLITKAMPTEDLSLRPRLQSLDNDLANLTNAEKANADAVAKLGPEPEPNVFADPLADAPPPERMTPAPEGPLDDENLNLSEMNKQLTHITEQLNDLIAIHGSFETAPPEIQQAMSELAMRGQRFNERINAAGRVNQLKKQSKMFRDWWNVHNAEQGNLSAGGRASSRVTPAIPGQIDIDWESSLREGMAVTMPIRQLLSEGHQMPTNFGVGLTMGKELKTIAYGQGRTARTGQRTLIDTLESLFSDGSVLPRRRPPGARLAREEAVLARQLGVVEEGGAALEQRATELGTKAREAAAGHRAKAAALEAQAEVHRAAMEPAAAREAELTAYTARDPELMRGQARIAKHYNEARARATTQYNTALNQHNMHLGRVRAELAKAQGGMAGITSRENYLNILMRKAERAAKNRDNVTAREFVRDMRQLSLARKALKPGDATSEAEYNAIESLLVSYYADASKMEMTQQYADNIEARLKQFKNASAADKVGSASLVNPVTERVWVDGWTPLAELILEKDQSERVIAQALADGATNLHREIGNGNTWNLVDKYTAFFKAYATSRPGFHVRNAMSGVFMNTVAGVPIAHQLEAMPIWREFRANPREFWEGTTDRVRAALAAMMSTGGGGQFSEGFDLTNRSMAKGTRVYNFLMNNRLMQWNRRVGEKVEGVMRLGMALDSIDRGHTISDAMNRIAKYHFDYREISRLDKTAKRLIPFWTFMSRNFPLQIEQMWARPKTYLWYQSLVRNFSEDPSPLTPGYWLAQGAFTMDPTAQRASGDDAPWYLAPDLPHLRIAEPLVAASQGEWSKVGISDINPLLLAPFEAMAMGKKAYTGAPIEGYEKLSMPMAMLYPIFAMLGQTATGGRTGNTLVDERAAHIARSTIPPIDMLERLIPGWGDPESLTSGRELETMARFLGIPAYNLTPQLRNSTARRNVSDRRNDARDAAEIARM